MRTARRVRVRGVVQGVGFRPFVYRLARDHSLDGWVLNDEEGVDIHVEGDHTRLDSFLVDLRDRAPQAAAIAHVEVAAINSLDLRGFRIRSSERSHAPTASICPDLTVCEACLAELRDPDDPRHGYLYINCTECGPRYSIVQELPYDREGTTMAGWRMDPLCAGQYRDPASRRYHAQPIACPGCGPGHRIRTASETISGDAEVVMAAVEFLRAGRIVGLKGVGGYHLSCDAANIEAVMELRHRKYRKEKPFALMARDLDVARQLLDLGPEAEELLASPARPIVLCPARDPGGLPGVAPDTSELGVMLPYTPLHHALFDAGAPELLVMTSGNRSSEPIVYSDEEAAHRLEGIADALVVGERAIARPVEDSVVRVSPEGPLVLRRGRGLAPASAGRIPTERTILALGADLKSAVTLVVGGEAVMSPYLGDLSHAGAETAFRHAVTDLLDVYRIEPKSLLVVRDLHPQYRSSLFASELGAAEVRSVQHHRAHVAAVLAEREAWEEPVVGIALDGTGFGDDGTIWGGELFAGSVARGLDRVGGLRSFDLVGGDAAARHPVQASVGFLNQIGLHADVEAPPFDFPDRFDRANRLAASGVRVRRSRSAGRLFDAVAALLGFVRPVTYEGQAATWLEQRAMRCPGPVEAYAFPHAHGEVDFRPAIRSILEDRIRSRDLDQIALAFHLGLAGGLARAAREACERLGARTVVLSGGVFQNTVLTHAVAGNLRGGGLEVWMHRSVPPNDGGIGLGQAALAAFSHFDGTVHELPPASPRAIRRL